jgi:hypothetical protein
VSVKVSFDGSYWVWSEVTDLEEEENIESNLLNEGSGFLGSIKVLIFRQKLWELSICLPLCTFEKEGHLSVMRIRSMIGWLSLIIRCSPGVLGESCISFQLFAFAFRSLV